MNGDDVARENLFSIEVGDFGPVSRANVDLRPLTVFLGKSNTGKSMLATLIYSLHKGLTGPDLSFGTRRADIDGNLNESIGTLIGEIDERRDASSEATVSLPDAITEFVRARFDRMSDYLDKEISRCFGSVNGRDLVRRGCPTAEVAMNCRMANRSRDPIHHLAIRKDSMDFRTAFPERIDIPVRAIAEAETAPMPGSMFWSGGEWSRAHPVELLQFLIEYLQNRLYGIHGKKVHCLPAGRTGIMRLLPFVTRTLIQDKVDSRKHKGSMHGFPGVLADFVDGMLTVSDSEPPPFPTDLYKHASSFEERILGGRVWASDQPVFPDYRYGPSGWNEGIDMHFSSSMISEMAPLVLHIQYLVEPGDLLIIEEPEAHLHPELQVELMKLLAVLVRAGTRVVITTHSEWMIEGLSNIVHASGLPEDHRKEVHLAPGQVGVWKFEDEGRQGHGIEVREIALEDYRAYPSGFDDVAIELHNQWADTVNRAGEGS